MFITEIWAPQNLTNITFTYDTSKLIYNGSNANNITITITITISGNTISWIDSLNTFIFGYNKFGSSNLYNFYFSRKPSVKIGDTLFAKVFINASSVSCVDSIYNIMRSSYDPNEKLATPELTTTQVANGDYINYTINFQNTGNDTAYNIVVADTLSNLLQTNNMEMIATSHNCNTIVQNGIIYFEFRNILLPDSFSNFNGSHGFVSFRIKTVNTLIAGDSITNKASIYFDYNNPVLTNTAVTNIVNTTTLPLKLIGFYGYKTDNNNQLTWNTANELNTLSFIVQQSEDGRIYKSAGEVSAIGKGNHSYNFIAVNTNNSTYYYRLIIKDKNGGYTYSNVICISGTLNNDKFTIFPNPAKDIITIEYNNIQQIKVVDNTGRTVLHKKLETVSSIFKMDVSGLSNGLYLMQVTNTNGETKTEKLMI